MRVLGWWMFGSAKASIIPSTYWRSSPGLSLALRHTFSRNSAGHSPRILFSGRKIVSDAGARQDWWCKAGERWNRRSQSKGIALVENVLSCQVNRKAIAQQEPGKYNHT